MIIRSSNLSRKYCLFSPHLFLTSIFLGCGKIRLILNRLLRTRPSTFFTPATCLLGLPVLPLGVGLTTGATTAAAAAAGGAAVAACALDAAATAALACLNIRSFSFYKAFFKIFGIFKESIFCCKSSNNFVAINIKISVIPSSASVTSPLSFFHLLHVIN